MLYQQFLRTRGWIFLPLALLLLILACGAESTTASPELAFNVVAVNKAATVDGVQHRIALQGHGTFTPQSVEGGGQFVRWDNAPEGTPKPILSSGAWRAKRVVRWIPNERTYGTTLTPGVLDLEIELLPD